LQTCASLRKLSLGRSMPAARREINITLACPLFCGSGNVSDDKSVHQASDGVEVINKSHGINGTFGEIRGREIFIKAGLLSERKAVFS
jgi:hypothetical protein